MPVKPRLRCPVCGVLHSGTTAYQRFLARPEHPNPLHCWVCRRLAMAVAAEAAEIRVYYSPGADD